MRHNCSPFEIVHCDGVYVLRLHSRSSTKRLRALCMANETWTLIIPPHYMVDHAGCCCQLQPTKSRKCSSSPCGWWEFFVTNGQKVLNFSFDFMHLLPAPKSVDEIEKAWFLLAKVSLLTQQLDGSSKVRGQLAKSIPAFVWNCTTCNVCSCVRKTQRGFRTGRGEERRCVNVDRLVVAKDSRNSLYIHTVLLPKK